MYREFMSLASFESGDSVTSWISGNTDAVVPMSKHTYEYDSYGNFVAIEIRHCLLECFNLGERFEKPYRVIILQGKDDAIIPGELEGRLINEHYFEIIRNDADIKDERVA